LRSCIVHWSRCQFSVDTNVLFIELISKSSAKFLTPALSVILIVTKAVNNRDTELLVGLIFTCFSFNARHIEMCLN